MQTEQPDSRGQAPITAERFWETVQFNGPWTADKVGEISEASMFAFAEAYAAAREQGATAQWVSVKERVPEFGPENPANTVPRRYLQVEFGRIVYGVIWKNYEAEGITFWLDWQPPAPPKEIP